MRYVDINEIRTGDILGENIRDNRGIVLLVKGKKLNVSNIISLRNRGFSRIVIEDRISDGIEIGYLSSEQSKATIIDGLKKLDIEKIQREAKLVTKELIANNVSLADMECIKTYDEYTYQHSYSVGMICAVMGLAAGFVPDEIENVTIAGLLHDLGKTQIPLEIINAPRRLTFDEFEEVKKHPRNAYDLLVNSSAVPSTIRVSILQHHENEDGTGYPKGIKGDKLYKFAKIIHIADVFDALTSLRPYRKPMTRHEAIAYIKNNNDTMFSKLFTTVFERCVPPYTTGSTVELGNGLKVIIVRNDTKDINNPYCRRIDTLEEATLRDFCNMD